MGDARVREMVRKQESFYQPALLQTREPQISEGAKHLMSEYYLPFVCTSVFKRVRLSSRNHMFI